MSNDMLLRNVIYDILKAASNPMTEDQIVTAVTDVLRRDRLLKEFGFARGVGNKVKAALAVMRDQETVLREDKGKWDVVAKKTPAKKMEPTREEQAKQEQPTNSKPAPTSPPDATDVLAQMAVLKALLTSFGLTQETIEKLFTMGVSLMTKLVAAAQEGRTIEVELSNGTRVISRPAPGGTKK